MDTSLSSVSKDMKPGSIKSITNKPLGSWYSIVFWSNEQKLPILSLGTNSSHNDLFLFDIDIEIKLFRKKRIPLPYFHWRLWHR